ncbi:MAG: hypothetical protein JNL76_06580 [Alphaproteobacteria bacterium]|nr:hypothetical protein [Alphaproteobacteria bacterium]
MGKKIRTGAGGVVDNFINQGVNQAHQKVAETAGGVIRNAERAGTEAAAEAARRIGSAVDSGVSGIGSTLSGFFNTVQNAFSGNPLSNLPARVDLTNSPDLKKFVVGALTILNHAPMGDQGIIEGLNKVISPSKAGVEGISDLKNVSGKTLALLYENLETKRAQSNSPPIKNQITTLFGSLEAAVQGAQAPAGLAGFAPTPAVQQPQRPGFDLGGGG